MFAPHGSGKANATRGPSSTQCDSGSTSPLVHEKEDKKPEEEKLGGDDYVKEVLRVFQEVKTEQRKMQVVDGELFVEVELEEDEDLEVDSELFEYESDNDTDLEMVMVESESEVTVESESEA